MAGKITARTDSREMRITYSRFACIGAGFSGINLGASLQRWYGESDITIFEKCDAPCGTWYSNKYPGCACDVPSALYSLSYEQKADWTRILPSADEIEKYLLEVAQKYDLIRRIKLNMEVIECTWDEPSLTWILKVTDLVTGARFMHHCQVLFAGPGQLSNPRDIDIPGKERFKGEIFHSARWNKNATLSNKDVIVIGNGCTAAQIVPSIVKETKSLTQIARSKHWIYPVIDKKYPKILTWMFKYIPFALALHRLQIYWMAEQDYKLFAMTPAAAKRRSRQCQKIEKFMRNTAPAKFHDALIPDFEVGCKRRIFDSGYLQSLNEPNIELTLERAVEIVPEGIKTIQRTIPADVIVLANGFHTNNFTMPMTIRGRRGVTLQEHWKKVGGAEAYNCTAIHGFPNLFLLLGPNSVTGHTSAIMACENTCNYALRVLRPVIDRTTKVVEIDRHAEMDYAHRIQADLKDTVWNSGCQSWYIAGSEKGDTWNAMSYPYSQAYFWYRCLFPIWSDWQFDGRAGTSSDLSKLVVPGLLCLLTGGLTLYKYSST